MMTQQNNNWEEATLLSIGGGQAVAMFDHELRKAIGNCKDPNTDTKQKRKVTLVVELLPDASRQNIGVTYQAKSALASDSAGEDHMVLAQSGKAFVNNAQQLLIEDYDEDVVGLGAAETAEGGEG
jgi:hypothetical protein